MSLLANIKPGATLAFVGTVRDRITKEPVDNIDEYTFACEVRTPTGELVGALECAALTEGQFTAATVSGQTDDWELGSYIVDAEAVDPDGVVAYSETFTVAVSRKATGGGA